ncbi:NAD(P)-dependent dehydrogenase (short-subunit alcohol dehydrogenase family) [Actinoplanes lutulentus]|uniref:NAD(P)-dependent dehydrogenase (Short-subunit alcohol dehydrogenase family) n=1 Tax=Actinoplanes lutulentus TaxID=1287878 RepID=A0A327YXR2_9ACTN|nr:SDR family oxidoreductase [Actinoplanes lutulentus]MBB2946499.1 NAD(P)-dependent dehydrogenase (short-subunit alcohol dehydrogenase family) [Actinoplanes lutulentus]RAK26417.1 NAD(P)-dependent dehydrogenase (short-subunit alcohol dehydrogenase family) [Actinoplanes lutulentus]
MTPAALVTGAAGAIGQATAAALGAAGMRLALADTDETALDAAVAKLPPHLRERTTAHRLDVTDDASCAEVVAAAVSAHGTLSLLVNGAGVMVRDTALQTSVATFQRVLDVNLTGAYRMSRAAHAALAGDGGAIVSISSTHAFLAAKGSFAYGVSKAGLSHLTRLLALEWAEDGIRVNAVAPTVVPSAMTEDVLADPGYVNRKMAAIPLGAPIAPEHVAAAVAYLASPGAASTTGQILVLDGGESLA